MLRGMGDVFGQLNYIQSLCSELENSGILFPDDPVPDALFHQGACDALSVAPYSGTGQIHRPLLPLRFGKIPQFLPQPIPCSSARKTASAISWKRAGWKSTRMTSILLRR